MILKLFNVFMRHKYPRSLASEHYRACGHDYVQDDQCGEESVAEGDPLFEIHDCHRGLVLRCPGIPVL